MIACGGEKAIRWIKGIRTYKTTLKKKERESMNQEELDKN